MRGDAATPTTTPRGRLCSNESLDAGLVRPGPRLNVCPLMSLKGGFGLANTDDNTSVPPPPLNTGNEPSVTKLPHFRPLTGHYRPSHSGFPCSLVSVLTCSPRLHRFHRLTDQIVPPFDVPRLTRICYWVPHLAVGRIILTSLSQLFTSPAPTPTVPGTSTLKRTVGPREIVPCQCKALHHRYYAKKVALSQHCRTTLLAA